MQQSKYFQKALSDFTYEAASGGAIRHLAALGYTARQISEQLTFPTPFGRVQQELWKNLVDMKVILLEEPGSGRQKARVSYVREYDKFGRAAFRQVVEEDTDTAVGEWKEYREAPRRRPASRPWWKKTGRTVPMPLWTLGLLRRKIPGAMRRSCRSWRNGEGSTCPACPGRTAEYITD